MSVLRMVTKIQKLSTHHFFRDMQLLWGNDVAFSRLIPVLDNVQLLPTTIKEVALAYNWDVKFLNLAVKLLQNYTTAKADGE